MYDLHDYDKKQRYVGRDLCPHDRVIIHKWSGQLVPKAGDVHLMLTDDENESLQMLMHTLELVTVDRGMAA